MTQEIGMAILVAGATFYLGRMLWRQSRGKSDCGCGKSSGCAPKPATSSTRSDAKLPPHLIQMKARDKNAR